MRAAVMRGVGGIDVLEVVELPDPSAGPGEVVVDIRAASVNADDIRVRSGTSRYGDMTLPHILGRDFSGVVRSVGRGADLQVGQEVFGVCLPEKDGGYAEKVSIAAAVIGEKPRQLDHAESAALALTGITALSAFEGTAQLQRGDEVLIHGGAGGVGGFAIQLAKHHGAEVTTTARAENAAYVKSLGADRVIDYNVEDFTALGPRFDVVYDTVGGEVQRQSATVLRPGGKLIVCGPTPGGLITARTDISIERPAVVRDRAPLLRIAELVTIGAVRPPDIRRFLLDEVAQAHRVIEGRQFRGKLVLEIR